MDTQVMAGHFISFHHRGLVCSWPSAGLLCPSPASDLVKQGGDNVLNEITSVRSKCSSGTVLLCKIFFFNFHNVKSLYFIMQVCVDHLGNLLIVTF